MDITPLFFLLVSPIIVVLNLSAFSAAERTTRVHVRSPTVPVDEGGILSFHCEVYHLKLNHEVKILRITDSEKAETLTSGNNVMSVEDRVFLAVRQLSSGSVVYFLTIIYAQKEDQGEYVCKVIQEGRTTTDIAVASSYLDIRYFPEFDPECTFQTTKVSYGETVTFSCSSNGANPTVTLKWTNGDKILPKNQTSIDDRQVSYLTVTPKDGDLFVCKIRSSAFPTRERSCHVGPFEVERDPSKIFPPDDDNNDIPHIPDLQIPIVRPPVHENYEPPVDIPQMTLDCEDDCRLLNSRSFYWIVSTCVTGLLALIFCIMCIILLCKYHYQSQRTYERGRCIATRPHVQDIYSELDIKRCDNNKEYMVLSNNRLLPGPPRHPDVTQTDPNKPGL